MKANTTVSPVGDLILEHIFYYSHKNILLIFNKKSFTDLPMENGLLVKDLFLSVPIIPLTLTAPPSVKSYIIS
jgi:hypothetical protein